MLESADRAVEPLRAAHAREIETLTAAAKEMGERGLPGRKEIVEQHQREERRFRTDALRAGLGVLARAYRGRVAGAAAAARVAVGDQDVRGAAAAVGLITESGGGAAPQPERGTAAAVTLRPVGCAGGLTPRRATSGASAMGRVGSRPRNTDWLQGCMNGRCHLLEVSRGASDDGSFVDHGLRRGLSTCLASRDDGSGREDWHVGDRWCE